MARPEKNTVDYFPFICAEGKKMYYLEETYGNDGFATFVKLLRELANTEYHYIDLSQKTTKMFLAARCKIDTKTLDSIIRDLVELGKFDAQLWSEFNVIWCQDFIDSIQDAYKKRSNECINKKGLRRHLLSLSKHKTDLDESEVSIKPQTILKKTIVEKKREKNTRAIEILKSQKQEELDILWMQNKNYIDDKKKLVESFNDKMDIEIDQGKIEFSPEQLMPRFRTYVRQWISNTNQSKNNNNPDPDSYESGKLPRK